MLEFFSSVSISPLALINNFDINKKKEKLNVIKNIIYVFPSQYLMLLYSFPGGVLISSLLARGKKG